MTENFVTAVSAKPKRQDKGEQIEGPRGMRDFPPDAWHHHREVADTIARVIRQHGFRQVQTPIVEQASLFTRSLGETTDVVSKEMFQLQDRRAPGSTGSGLVLRPENTAAVVRMAIAQRLLDTLPARFSYEGPMFRYERPQKGRYRQFHQCGVEYFEAYPSATATVEVIACGNAVLQALGLAAHVQLELNTIGTPAERARWREALLDYFRAQQSELSADSQRRLNENPLRILDSKHPADRAIAEGAPQLLNLLGTESRTHWESVQAGLDAAGVPYAVAPRLVRGLDYYSGVVFEFTTTTLGAQDAVIAGGRYDGLIPLLGGAEATAGIGWAGGIDRMVDMQQTLGIVPQSATRGIALVLERTQAGAAEHDATHGDFLRLLFAVREVVPAEVETPVAPFLLERSYPNRRKALAKITKTIDDSYRYIVHCRPEWQPETLVPGTPVPESPADGTPVPEAQVPEAMVMVRDLQTHEDIAGFSSITAAIAGLASVPWQLHDLTLGE